jgi:ATP-binding cassette subfamily B protein
MSGRQGRSENRRLARRILGEALPFWPAITTIFILDLLSTPLLLLTPLPLKIAVDSVLGSHPLPELLALVTPAPLATPFWGLLGLVVLLQVIVVLLSQFQELASYVVSVRTGEAMTLGFRARIFRHVQRLSLAFHDSRGVADSIYRLEVDAPSLQYLIVYGVLPAIAAAIAIVTTVYVIVLIDWQLALVAIAVSPLLVYLSVAYDERMRPRYRQVKRVESGALKVIQEVLGAVRVVKAFGREERETQRFIEQSREGVRSRIRLAFAEGVYGILVNLVTAVGTAAFLLIGIVHVRSGSLTLGSLLLVITYLAQLYSPLKQVTGEVAGMQGSLASVERAFELLREVPEVPEPASARPLVRARGAIEFRQVGFAYEGEHVLRDVSFAIPAGTRLGIAGKTGAGKTTLTSLLIRFYDPTEGAIHLDGVDLREYGLADLRSQFALVLQDSVLFSTSIAENIRYGRPEATDRQVRAAALAANAADFIDDLPQDYATLVGERGMRLSGGERQRIALARAFLKDAPILVLDEPTSSVDVGTEAGIMEAMERLMRGRTTIMIAHRLGTLDVCDQAIELGGGRILEIVHNEAPRRYIREAAI